MSTQQNEKLGSGPGDEFRPEQSWGGLVVEAGERIAKLGRAALRKADLEHLSFGRIGAMSVLLAAPRSQAELAVALGQKAPSMSELLQRMEKEGLVRSTPDERDGRRTNWSLTTAGRRDILRAQAVFRTAGKRIDALFAGSAVSPKELERSKEILLLFLKNAKL